MARGSAWAVDNISVGGLSGMPGDDGSEAGSVPARNIPGCRGAPSTAHRAYRSTESRCSIAVATRGQRGGLSRASEPPALHCIERRPRTVIEKYLEDLKKRPQLGVGSVGEHEHELRV